MMREIDGKIKKESDENEEKDGIEGDEKKFDGIEIGRIMRGGEDYK